MLAEISAGLSSLKAAFDITKGLNAANTQASVNEVKLTLQQHLLEAQQALSAANDAQASGAQRIAELEQEIVRLKDWSSEKQRYQLKRYRPGALAYTLKPEMAAGDPPHHLCANCYQRGEKSILQATGDTIMRDRVHLCPSCKTKVIIGSEMAEAASSASEVSASPSPRSPDPYREQGHE